MKINFHLHLQDESYQNKATTFQHMKMFIDWMYDNNVFIKGGKIDDITDQYSKQNRYANTMWILSVLEFT